MAESSPGGDAPARAVPRAKSGETRAAPDTTRRLESVENTLKMIFDKVEDLTISVRNLRDQDGDLEAKFTKFVAKQSEQSEALASTLKQMQQSFTEALQEEARSRKTQAETFEASLKEQGRNGVDALKAALMKGAADTVGGWIVTTTGMGIVATLGWLAAHGGHW